jgi:ERCC4-related helicase
VQEFREGAFNVIVSTSIGEEGLDIGEVDLVVCFDASASPLRMIQRMGRTGRKRQGRVDILLDAAEHIGNSPFVAYQLRESFSNRCFWLPSVGPVFGTF